MTPTRRPGTCPLCGQDIQYEPGLVDGKRVQMHYPPAGVTRTWDCRPLQLMKGGYCWYSGTVLPAPKRKKQV